MIKSVDSSRPGRLFADAAGQESTVSYTFRDAPENKLPISLTGIADTRFRNLAQGPSGTFIHDSHAMVATVRELRAELAEQKLNSFVGDKAAGA